MSVLPITMTIGRMMIEIVRRKRRIMIHVFP